MKKFRTILFGLTLAISMLVGCGAKQEATPAAEVKEEAAPVVEEATETAETTEE